MSSATYKVVKQGMQPGYSAEMVADLLSSLFKCSKEQIAPLLGSKPATVKKGMTYEAAKKYAQALERCGCVCTVEEEVAFATAPVATPLSHRQLASVIPVLRRIVRPGLEADPVVIQPFAGDLEVAFRTEQGSTLVRQSALRASMMTVEKLYQLAVWNLYARLHPRLTFSQMATEEPAGDQPGARFFSYIDTEDGFAASCLLLWPIWQAVAEQVTSLRGPLRIAVPNARTCVFCGAGDEIAFAMMSDIASETLSEAGAEALSGLTYSVDGAGRVSVVEGADLQRLAPAPAMNLAGAAQLVAPTLHAHAENAALLALSEERLHRLQPVLFELAKWSQAADRETWLESIRHTLARGDSRAAVVVDAAHAVVATYTDELDCVALLQFDPGLALVHGWQNGTRLLSANSYFGRDKGIAPDLQPGPGDTGRWGNFWPLIADLLTDDQASLAARKRLIGEAEWDRTWQLGRRVLAERGTARDGRPLGSRQAAEPATAAPVQRVTGGRSYAVYVGIAMAVAIGLACLWSVVR